MSKELAVQAAIRKSVIADGGYSHKLTNQFTVGIPDLLVAMWPYIPCIVEVKDLGVVVDEFDRKLDVTPKQTHELVGISRVYGEKQHPYTPKRRASCVLVALVHRGMHTLVAVKVPVTAPGEPPIEWRLNYKYEQDPACFVAREKGGYYNISPLLQYSGICTVAAM
jgi:hypothetical protein